MKTLHIMQIVATLVAVIPVHTDSSAATAQAIQSVQNKSTSPRSVINGTQVLYYKNGDTGYLECPEQITFSGISSKIASKGQEEAYGNRIYLPVTTIGKWHDWNYEKDGKRAKLPLQKFDFVIDTSIVQSYFALQVSVDGYKITSVKLVPLNDLTDADLDNPYKMTTLQLNILSLCAQYCMFADQLQYNSTIAGRGAIPSTVRAKVYNELTALLRMVDAYEAEPNTKRTQVAAKVRQLIGLYITNYADEYNAGKKAQRMFEYLKGATDLSSAKKSGASAAKSLGGIAAFAGLIAGGILTWPVTLPLGIFAGGGAALIGAGAVGGTAALFAGASGAALGGFLGVLSDPVVNFGKLENAVGSGLQEGQVNSLDRNVLDANITVTDEQGNDLVINPKTDLLQATGLTSALSYTQAWNALAITGKCYLINTTAIPSDSQLQQALNQYAKQNPDKIALPILLSDGAKFKLKFVGL